jgi:hypothetical protein
MAGVAGSVQEFEVKNETLVFRGKVDKGTLDAEFQVTQGVGAAGQSGNLKEPLTAFHKLWLAQGTTTLYVKDSAVWLKYDWHTGMFPRQGNVEVVKL